MYGCGWGSGQSRITTCKSFPEGGIGVFAIVGFGKFRHGLRAALLSSVIGKQRRDFL